MRSTVEEQRGPHAARPWRPLLDSRHTLMKWCPINRAWDVICRQTCNLAAIPPVKKQTAVTGLCIF